jgi:hypothetical protein
MRRMALRSHSSIRPTRGTRAANRDGLGFRCIPRLLCCGSYSVRSRLRGSASPRAIDALSLWRLSAERPQRRFIRKAARRCWCWRGSRTPSRAWASAALRPGRTAGGPGGANCHQHAAAPASDPRLAITRAAGVVLHDLEGLPVEFAPRCAPSPSRRICQRPDSRCTKLRHRSAGRPGIRAISKKW